MIVKLLIGLAILLALVRMLSPRRPGRRQKVDDRQPAPPPRVPRAQDLVKCERCGIWLPAGHRCDCAARV